jgi:hypothetical protein
MTVVPSSRLAGGFCLFPLVGRLGTTFAEGPAKNLPSLGPAITFTHRFVSEKNMADGRGNPLEFRALRD